MVHAIRGPVRAALSLTVVGLVACGGASTGSASGAGPQSSIVPACEPACSGKQCGADGCGGTCGSCQDGETCSGGGACTVAMGLVTLRYGFVKSASSCYRAGTAGTCTVTTTVPAAQLAEIASNYSGCSASVAAGALAIDCTGNCSTVDSWCSSTNSYASMLSCGLPGNGGVLWDDALVAGGEWTISFNGNPPIPMLLFGAPECVTAKIGMESPAYFYGSFLDGVFSVTGSGEVLGGTLDPSTMTMAGVDTYGMAPYIQQVPFTAVKVP